METDIQVAYSEAKRALPSPLAPSVTLTSAQQHAAHTIVTLARKYNVGSTQDIQQCALACLQRPSAYAADEKSLLLETAAISSALLSSPGIVEQQIAALKAIHGETSTRVSRLTGLLEESRGRAETAAGIYAELPDERGGLGRRRVVGLRRTDGGVEPAIKALSAYLELYAADLDAWLEMTNLQLRAKRLPQAIFSLEEAILLAPNRADLHTFLAQVKNFLAIAILVPSSFFWQTSTALQTIISPCLFLQLLAVERTVDSLRVARLHACEAVRLTEASNAWSLTVLADVCWLHVSAALGRDIREAASEVFLVLEHPTLEGIVTKASRFTPLPAPALDEKKASDLEEEELNSIHLHALACDSLSRLPSDPSMSEERRGEEEAFPFLTIARTCTSTANKQRLATQATQLARLL
jgi:tetratricopeptide (TPR) repeat protein